MCIGRRVRSALLALLAGAGCGGPTDDLPREPIRGQVRFAGKPLGTGTILFLPAQGTAETQAYSTISDGAYSIPRQEGPVPGTYKVVISSVVAAPAPAGPPGKVLAPPKELIPARYNTKSDQFAAVKKGEENRFDFDLK
jgi:hypothetical protein